MVTGICIGIAIYQTFRPDPGPAPGALEEVARLIEDNYVEPVAHSSLMNAAIGGMLQGLDAHTSYLDEDAFARLRDDTAGQFSGIGIELGLVNGYFTVIAPIDGSPASVAGLRSGDRLLAVDQQSLEGQVLDDAVRWMRGPLGSRVLLRVQRDEGPAFDLTIERALIENESVSHRWLRPGVAYVRISQFRGHTGADFANTLRKLDLEQDVQGLVLDLRNNPGGVLQASVAVADALLESGLITYTEGRQPASHAKYQASGEDVIDGAPVVVLITAGSASASEVVAGALRDQGRAKLAGSRTFGKGSVQSVIPLPGDLALKLTTAYYFTPNGTSIHGAGIEPDVELESADEEALIDLAVGLLGT
jgi:carboxyl-terminal processing protease